VEGACYKTCLGKHGFSLAKEKVWRGHDKDLKTEENSELAQVKASVVRQDKWV